MKIRACMTGAMVAAASSGALAGTTSFNINDGGGSEPSLRTIFGNIYGGSFNPVSAGSVNYTNGTVTLTRVQDYISAVGATGLQMVNGSTLGTADDNRWSDGTVSLHFEAKYAANSNTLGWYNNNTGGTTFQSLLGSVPGSSVTTMLSSSFEWGLKTVSGSSTTYLRSNKFANSGNEDHMVSYKVTGLAGGERWLMAWEDLPFYCSDIDYNDWVGEMTVVTVPLPSSVWAGLAGLGGVAGLRLRRRRA